MKKISFCISILFILVIAGGFRNKYSNENQAKKFSVLVFSKTNGFYHSSIPVGITALEKLAAENNFEMVSSKDSLDFNEKNLKKFDLVIFLNTTGDVLGTEQQAAFEKFIRSGKGFVGVHAATDTEYDWPWYNGLVGAYFKNHPEQQQARLIVKDRNDKSTKHLPAEWSRWDEWYNFKDTHWDKVKVLVTLDEQTIKGGGNGDFHPVSWSQQYDGGRAFYTALGHTDASYSDTLFLQHLLGGILYAAGK